MYNRHKQQLEEISDDIVEGIRCQWYEKGEKPNDISLNLEKKREIHGQIRKVIANEKEISDEK